MAERKMNQPARDQSVRTTDESTDASLRSEPLPMDSQSARPSRMTAGQVESYSRQNITLMKRIKARDETALAELYDRYAGAVYALARHILTQAADAEEVVADTFWEVWRKADRYDPARGSVVSYIMLLARSRAIDRARQARSRDAAQNRLQEAGMNSTNSADPEDALPEADIMVAERRMHIRDLLADLPVERREAIELSFLKGLTHQQIAAVLDVPLGTVKTRIRQGLIQLYEQLRIHDGGPSV